MTTKDHNQKQNIKTSAGEGEVNPKTSSKETSRSLYDLIEEQDMGYYIKHDDIHTKPKANTGNLTKSLHRKRKHRKLPTA